VNHRLKATLVFLAASALYFVTRTPALDEHDSVQFALGVLDFNIWKDQPHAPGYPIFIFLGWLAQKFLGLGPDLSFHLISAIGGGLFIAMWFLIIRAQFHERLAWWITICLTITPAVWMTATKALTDSLACGLLAAEIFFVTARTDRFRRSVMIAALYGAAACGVRPQLFPVTLVVLLWRTRAQMKMSILSLGVLVLGCLIWLLPMNYAQWRLHPQTPFWSVFPNLAWHQWSWRLDKAGVYLGAGDWSAQYLATRSAFHFLGWFALGFGFMKSPALIVMGSVFTIVGLTSYFTRVANRDASFWRFHALWAITHVAIIFITLSPAQRYYLPIFPLLLIALLRGWMQLPAPLNRAAIALPALLLYAVIPLAIQNHREKPPALQLVEFVRQLYPESRRSDVVLLFNKARRHAEWYAPGFTVLHDTPPAELNKISAEAAAVYTDDAKAPLPAGWRRIPLVIFMRSGIIYWKHHAVELYLIDRSGR
jgi:hypothetical protein